MGFQDDWMMRQIEMLSRYVAQIVFKKKEASYTFESDSPEALTDTDRLYLELDRLIRERRICEAEDMLFDNMVYDDKYVELAMDFYQKLNDMTDQELEECDFSREEVYDGYTDILTRLGIPVEQFTD